MPQYRILNTVSGLDLGAYAADSEQEALDLMARDAGYSDYADLDEEVPSKPGEIVVREVRPPGRPPMPPDRAMSVRFELRLTQAQRDKLDALGGSEWLRDKIDSARLK